MNRAKITQERSAPRPRAPTSSFSNTSCKSGKTFSPAQPSRTLPDTDPHVLPTEQRTNGLGWATESTRRWQGLPRNSDTTKLRDM